MKLRESERTGRNRHPVNCIGWDWRTFLILEINIFSMPRDRWKLCDEKNPEAKNLVTLYL
jgi:hypothetical protein